MALDLARYRFSLDQYERMVETGVLTEDDRVELIEGEILEMPPQHPPHTTPVRRLTRALMEGVGDRAVVLIQMPIRLPPSSEPEPDLALARPPDERYVARHPEPQDLLLVVEVSHTTQLYDRNMKIPLYARQGIRELWLIDVPAERFEVYREPGPDGYETVENVARGGTVTPLAFPDVRIAVDDVLP